MKLHKAGISAIVFLFNSVAVVAHAEPVRAQVNPARVAQILGRETSFDGPNCWASTLYLLDIRDRWTYMSPSEFEIELDHACSAISPSQRQEGDLILVKAPVKGSSKNPDEQFHAYIFISEALGLSKEDFESGHALKYTSHKEILKPYHLEQIDQACLKDPSQPKDLSACANYVEVQRCQKKLSRRSMAKPLLIKRAQDLEIAFSNLFLNNPSPQLSKADEEMYIEKIQKFDLDIETDPLMAPIRESLAFQWMAIQWKSYSF